MSRHDAHSAKASARGKKRTIDRVPRSPDEEALLLETRPTGWEYLLWAAVLRRGIAALEPKWQEHEEGTRRAGGVKMTLEQAFARLAAEPSRVAGIVDTIDASLEPAAQERAFGKPGEPGDVQLIKELAGRLVRAYDELLEWSAGLRATGVPRELRRIFDLTSELARRPLIQTYLFVEDVVEALDEAPAALREHRPVELTLTLTLSTDPGLTNKIERETRRIMKLMERGT